MSVKACDCDEGQPLIYARCLHIFKYCQGLDYEEKLCRSIRGNLWSFCQAHNVSSYARPERQLTVSSIILHHEHVYYRHGIYHENMSCQLVNRTRRDTLKTNKSRIIGDGTSSIGSRSVPVQQPSSKW